MRIGMVNDTVYPYFRGGVPKRVWEISKRLAQRGHSVHQFGLKYWDGEDTIIKEGVYLHGVCPARELYGTDGRRSAKPAIYFAFKLLGPLLREKFDIIDCSNFPYFPCFPAKAHSIVKGSALVITWHEVWGDYWYEYLGRKGIFGKWIEGIASHLSNTIVAISENTKRGLLSLGVKGSIIVVPNGIDFEEINAASPAGMKSDIVFVGRLIGNKNVDLLVRAIGIVKQAIPSIKCIIIGDGPERSRLVELASCLCLEKSVSFLGSVDNCTAFSLLKASKVFVLPSTREGFGIVLLEANACGLPVVTVRHPRNAATDLIIEGENGFLCEFDEKDMAEKIIVALGKAQGMSVNCLAYSKEYNWDKVVDMMEVAYESAKLRG